ncbi:FliC/FljB family flagellin [Chromohalobacter sp. 48-RD10]|uniref:FliC/FljB family flagellin n=1 Tax=Chromohalobacter sp. 48-RD10 TaxID=2994063 RepID=UPI0024690D77|nr:FliC/FljB family flagellin [Chromohalobacter sp. 48-RD10]
MIGQQNLSQSQNDLSTSMERLSSGLKINSAADDAAGQAIANRMSSQINGLSQAQSNANDGISVAQTTEGALNQVNDNLQRVRELTVQAENGTNSQEDLDSIQDEINQRLGEIDRISEETSFNGVDVLAKDQEMSIQVGSEDGQTITMNLQEVNSESLQLGDFNVNGPKLAEAVESGSTMTVSGTEYDIEDNGTTGANGTGAYAVSEGTTANTPIDSGNNTLVQDSEGNAFVKNDAGGDVSYYKADLDVTESTGSQAGEISYTVAEDAEAANVNLTTDEAEAATGNPLSSLDDAIGQVDSQRSELGALQNRFDSAITNLNTTETNLTSARSRIEDADYADEVSNMTKNQILQQAGTSVLSQANQLPQNALSLLG